MKRSILLSILFYSTFALAQAPSSWKVNSSEYEHFMTFTSILKINTREVMSTKNVVAAFHGSSIRGVSVTQIIEGRTFHFIQVYGNAGDGEITFKAYDGEVMDTVLIVTDILDFIPSESFGDVLNPHEFVAINDNMPPVAIAGEDIYVREGRSTILNGNKSWSSTNDVLSFDWSADPLITLDSSKVPLITFTAPLFDKDTVLTAVLTVTNSKLKFSSDTVSIFIANNLAPISIAKADLSLSTTAILSMTDPNARVNYVFPSSSIALDGSDSYDPEEDNIEYLWSNPNDIAFSSATDQNPTFTIPSSLINGTVKISLAVNDYELTSFSDTIPIIVSNNTAPEINMVFPSHVLEGDTVYLDGSKTVDKEGDDIEYFWFFPKQISLSDTVSNTSSFITPNIEADTTYQIRFGAWDGKFGSFDTLIIFIKNNTPPIANANTDFTLREGKKAELDAYFSYDPDSRPLNHTWTSLSNLSLENENNALSYFIAPKISDAQSDYKFQLKVNDGYKEDFDTTMVTVINNMPPVAKAGSEHYVLLNTEGQLDGSKSYDFEKDTLSFNWSTPSNIVLSDSLIAKPTFTAPNWMVDTSVFITLQVSDYFEKSAIDTLELFIVSNLPPIAIAGLDQLVKPDSIVMLDGSASYDPDGAFLQSFSWESSSNISLLGPSLDDSISFIVPDYGTDSVITFTLEVQDIEKSSKDIVAISIVDNFPPIAIAGPDTIVIEGRSLQLDGSKSYDPEGENLSYLWKVLSGYMIGSSGKILQNILPKNIEIESSPSEPKVDINTPFVVGNGEVFILELSVNDGSKTSRDTISISVNNNRVPIANAGEDFNSKEGQEVFLNGGKSLDPDGQVLTYDWISSNDLNLNNETKSNPNFITPAVLEDSLITIFLRVSDSDIWSKLDTVNINVSDNISPVANAGLDKTVLSGSIVELDGSSSIDADGDSLLFSWVGPKDIKILDIFKSKATFLAPIVSEETILRFMLNVSDGGAPTTPDTVLVTIESLDKYVSITDPGSQVPAGIDFPISLSVTDDFNAKEINILYSKGGDETVTSIVMDKGSTNSIDNSLKLSGKATYTGVIPGKDISANGFYYRIQLIDDMNVVQEFGHKQIMVLFEQLNVSTEIEYSGYPEGIAQNNWRLISFPGNLKTSTIDSVLILSNFDQENYDEIWKLWGWSGQEWLDPIKIKPGVGYWFKHREKLPAHLFLGSGSSVELDSFEYKIKPGWSLVSSPYTFPIKVLLDQNKLIGPYEYISQESGWADDFPRRWYPFKSYAVYNNSENDVSIKLNFNNLQNDAGTPSDRIKAYPPNSWSIDLMVKSKNHTDKNNIFGIASSASNEKDTFDHPEPPDITSRTTISYKNNDAYELTRNYKSLSEGQTWDALLKLKNQSIKTEIIPIFYGQLPNKWRAVLINKNDNKIFSIDGSSIFIKSLVKKVELIIIAGPPNYIKDKVSEYQISIPTEFALNQNYPNPFNPITNITYDIAKQGLVRITIYDIMGREINTLTSKHHLPGKYKIAWRGQDVSGYKAAAGIYFYQLSTPDFTKTKKMVLLK